MTMQTKSDGATADYYVLPNGATELQHLISHRDMNAQIGEIFRACYRYGIASHSDKLRDAKKILFYAKAEVARLEELIASDDAGWIEWSGGDCPVEGWVKVLVKLRSGVRSSEPEFSGLYSWENHGLMGDIIAYKVIKDNSK